MGFAKTRRKKEISLSTAVFRIKNAERIPVQGDNQPAEDP
jgi:hypothetical protein